MDVHASATSLSLHSLTRGPHTSPSSSSLSRLPVVFFSLLHGGTTASRSGGAEGLGCGMWPAAAELGDDGAANLPHRRFDHHHHQQQPNATIAELQRDPARGHRAPARPPRVASAAAELRLAPRVPAVA